MPFDPLRRPGARLNRHLHYQFSARTGRSAPDADSDPQQAPDATVAVAAAGISAAPGHAEAQLPIIATGSAETAVSDSTGVTTPSEVCASTATAPSSLPAASVGGQTEPVSIEQMSLLTAQGADDALGGAAGQSGAESLQQGYTATAVGGSSSAVLASGNAEAESTEQVTSGTAAAANTTAAQHSSASAAASVNIAASVHGAASDPLKSHMLPMAAKDDGLTLAQQNLRSHQIELLPEDEEDFYPVPQQLQELPPHPTPPLGNVGGLAQTQSQTQSEGVQRQAVSSLYSATEQDSDMADVSSQQVVAATAGNNVAGGALPGPLSSSEGQKSGLFVISGEGEMDMKGDAHREPSSNVPPVYIEDMPIAR